QFSKWRGCANLSRDSRHNCKSCFGSDNGSRAEELGPRRVIGALADIALRLTAQPIVIPVQKSACGKSHQIGTERPCVDWPGQVVGGRLIGNYARVPRSLP